MHGIISSLLMVMYHIPMQWISKIQFPKYDTAKAIYNDILDRLDVAIGKLNPNNPSFNTADLIYSGDVEKWIKFGNSIKLKWDC
jgi:hypothetical protein